MNEIKSTVISFLKSYNMYHRDIEMEEYNAIFLEEMEKGLQGEESSLMMIPTYIGIEIEVPRNERVIVMDAGGTNLRSATVCFDDAENPVIANFRNFSMPGSQGRVSKDEFFSIMGEYIKGLLPESDRIGFCFSYAVDMNPNKDGRLTKFSKEVDAPEVEGELIGANLIAALGSQGANKRVILLNDTVATLLAGRAAFSNRKFDSYVGLILGTGTNTCYIESNINITKTPGLDKSKSQIINVESGGFGSCPRGAIDLAFDDSTIDPGMYTFEKMVSGRYLGPLFLKILKVGCEDGLFSPPVRREVKEIERLETKELNDFLHNPENPANAVSALCISGSEKDVITAYYIADKLVERAAKLTAINLAAVVIQSEKGGSPTRPVCITAEGTTFYEMKSLSSRAEGYLNNFLKERYERYYEIVQVDNATLLGAAIAGLTN